MLNEAEIRAWPAALFLCILLFIAAFGAYSGLSQRPTPCGRETKNIPQEANGESAGLFTNPTQSGAKSQENACPSSGQMTSDWWLVYATAALVVVGAGQLGLFFWQLRLIRASLADAQKASVAARDSAIAAKETAETMKDTAQKQLRAYVTAQTDFISSFNTTNFPFATFKIVNVGSTPAHEVQYSAIIDVFPHPLPRDFSVPPIPPLATPPIVVFPHGGGQSLMTGQVAFQRYITEEESNDICNEVKRIYIFGCLKYNDIWGALRETKFSVSVTGDSDTLKKLTSNYRPSDLNIRFYTTPIYNDAT
jgi:hypothetical protein